MTENRPADAAGIPAGVRVCRSREASGKGCSRAVPEGREQSRPCRVCSLIAVLCPLRAACAARAALGLGMGSALERLGSVGCTHCCASTSDLSTWWSTTALERDLVLRRVSRLDAFSGYPCRT